MGVKKGRRKVFFLSASVQSITSATVRLGLVSPITAIPSRKSEASGKVISPPTAANVRKMKELFFIKLKNSLSPRSSRARGPFLMINDSLKTVGSY